MVSIHFVDMLVSCQLSKANLLLVYHTLESVFEHANIRFGGRILVSH